MALWERVIIITMIREQKNLTQSESKAYVSHFFERNKWLLFQLDRFYWTLFFFFYGNQKVQEWLKSLNTKMVAFL